MQQSTSSRRRTLGTGSIALSLGICLGAGQIVATQPAVAATPVVTAAAMRPLAKVTQKASAKSVKYGASIRITTFVANPSTGKKVTSGMVRLQALRSGKWQTWQTRTILKSGAYTFSFKPLVSGTYRTVFLGGGGVRAAVSRNNSSVSVTNKGAMVLAEAARHKGALYKYGAAGPKRFDCSGFTLYVYKKTTGRKLPHKANSQQKYGRSVSKGSRQPGDLIIFRSGSYGYHAAVYAGANKIWDSPHSGARVSKRKMISGNYVVRRLV
ncbi:NlpC/P60 family protein [Actinoplanes sp. NPDC051470]|uniref:C40 family peptidase n=1 Tax=unclassified Actinoplanes TaxID=2626549 RepID=UPI003443A81D